MTASDSRGSKSRLTNELTLRHAIGSPPVSSMSRTTIEALAFSRPLASAWFHFSTWRVPRMAKLLREGYERDARPVTS